ncbi:hypothetical protein CLAFUW4_05666 [Fulvia fulva]|uniref:F-box domain-containing protein n=1 Tax=Passalora fulva TaxID=5499 RepID=A0A9Q8P9D6_PASFU|nr:uncharacterized protein CLAFUR5_05807 [Fulvia fulva]KAK4624450.1 hypothetical protein CLAFUR4_05660 [Fulvia fulva]KAK4625807.1 hypothetical protein CLAFUR0_05668 [Fulvia fulva]UJO18149.1 hypothetical protein CLAFUR5_05807 [Fulvia fulva]WPV14866.1 hypothetical protein CLAFUW4_05666 [Fulvia fulva]WPV30003.1 hypothetical protein CLAFUW7_05665 [Fulvia fulva]
MQAEDESSRVGFLSLSPELRNRVYELAFEPPLVLEAHLVVLLKSTPPPKALLPTCRTVYEEARKMHHATHRQSWTTNQFCIHARTADLANILHKKHVSRDLDRMTSFQIIGGSDPDPHYHIYSHWRMLPQREGWIYCDHSGMRVAQVKERVRPKSMSKTKYAQFHLIGRPLSEQELDHALKFGLEDPHMSVGLPVKRFKRGFRSFGGSEPLQGNGLGKAMASDGDDRGCSAPRQELAAFDTWLPINELPIIDENAS